jgi:hypothetical protein
MPHGTPWPNPRLEGSPEQRSRCSIPVARLVITLAILAPLTVEFAVGAERAKGGGERIVGLKYHEPKQAEFLKAVLKSMNLRYTVTSTPEGELVEWVSTDATQECEIQNRG